MSEKAVLTITTAPEDNAISAPPARYGKVAAPVADFPAITTHVPVPRRMNGLSSPKKSWPIRCSSFFVSPVTNTAMSAAAAAASAGKNTHSCRRPQCERQSFRSEAFTPIVQLLCPEVRYIRNSDAILQNSSGASTRHRSHVHVFMRTQLRSTAAAATPISPQNLHGFGRI